MAVVKAKAKALEKEKVLAKAVVAVEVIGLGKRMLQCLQRRLHPKTMPATILRIILPMTSMGGTMARDCFLFHGVSILTPATSLGVAVMCAMAGGVSHVSLGLFGTRSARA